MTAHFLESGAGPGVLCLHSNAATSSQWRGLMDSLAGAYRVVAADSLGAGKSPPWPTGREVTLADEANLVAPLIDHAGGAVRVVGHSYGAAVALKLALMHPGRVRALALYEPTLFALLERDTPGHPRIAGIRDAVHDSAKAYARGDTEAGAARFIDYWMGEGALASMPPPRREPVVAAVANAAGWWHALSREPASLESIAALDIPVLIMQGGRTTEAARSVAEMLQATLPRVEHIDFPELGHMGPLTHPQVVNPVIAEFLDRVDA